MMKAIVLACLASTVSCANSNRTISWYIGVDSNDTLSHANANAVAEHKELFTQLLLWWGPGVPDNGTLTGWDNEAAVHQWLSIFKPFGLPITPCVIDIDNATIMHEIYKAPTEFAQKLVSIGKKYGFQGFNFDYEPEYPTDTHAQEYASFLDTVIPILHAEGFTLSVWVASWSQALNKYSMLCKTGVQYLMDMSTYGGSPMHQMKDTVNAFTKDIREGMGNTTQAGVGLGPYKTDYWTPSNTREFISYSASKGVNNLDIFRLLMDGEHNWPAPFWWPILEDFMNGTI
eukprot:TRINITY_DN5247_c0_g1_i1.p1 TRINITY_DN5247_c0_g1~~TRINITY_DN5247_c0_g1_i1.p1  ORF type:complete len:300 (+),score=66.77 TRINITY_DN5247_c0_g1_i1:42-902(+)